MLDLGPLRAGFAGELLTPSDAGYDDARSLFNSMIDKKPAVIAKATSVADVQAALAFGRANSLAIGVRAGGHGVAGHALTEGGLVIDLREMNAARVDPAKKTITVGGGATWAVLDTAAAEHGLATTGGRVSTTGVAGLSLGGGSGWIERKFGLACDNLLEVKLVAADGSLVTANETENADLFWAMHGAGHNFGVVVEMTFQLHDMPAICAVLTLWTPDKGPQVLRKYREFIQSAPDEVGGGFIYLTGPPLEFVPPHIQGQRACAVLITYTGTEEETQKIAAPIQAFAEPEATVLMPLPYPVLQSMLDDPPGFRNYWSVEHLAELPDAAIDAFCARAETMPVPTPTQFIILPWGGAVARNAAASPQVSRDAAWVMHPLTLWEEAGDDDANIAWSRAACADMKPFSTGAVYLNFVGDEGEDRVMAAYGKANYERLAEIKATYDPDNVFRGNQNIKPLA